MPILMSSERALYLELRCRAAAALPPQPQTASRRSVRDGNADELGDLPKTGEPKSNRK
jgi:hypothetical protein